MSIDDLLASLGRKRQEMLDGVWHRAETKAVGEAARADRDLATLREEHRQRLRQAGEVQRIDILRQNGEETRRLRLRAEQELAERLRRAAESLLPSLRDADYAATFARLAAELPQAEWERLRVHPDDVGLARRLPGAAAVEPCASIHGGLLATAAGGGIEVDNTLERRLARAWNTMLPAMVRELCRDLEKDGTPATAPTA
ncbi:MAG: V-type ATP synthase subunit E [Thermodesulfobacteriota bacterium]